MIMKLTSDNYKQLITDLLAVAIVLIQFNINYLHSFIVGGSKGTAIL